MTDCLARYALIGQPSGTVIGQLNKEGSPLIRQPNSSNFGKAFKILRLAAFAPSYIPPAADCNLRVYVVEDTHDALEVI